MRYGYATIKVVPDYGETAEIERFLKQVNDNGWRIAHVLSHDGKYFTFIYETDVRPTDTKHRKQARMAFQGLEEQVQDASGVSVQELPDA